MSTITTVQGNFRSNAVQIAADIAQFPLQTNYIQWQDLKSKQNLALHPQGQVPSMQTPEGNLTQTNALLVYVALNSKEAKLYGANDLQKGLVNQWLNFGSYELLPALMPQLLNIWGFKQPTQQEITESQEKTEKLLSYLNDKVLNGNQYFVGSEITIADISIFSGLVYAYRCVFSAEQRSKFANVTAWYERVAENASVVKYFGKNRYPSKPW